MKHGCDPRGWVCECLRFVPYNQYVRENWETALIHECDNCGRIHFVQRGIATLAAGIQAEPKEQMEL